MSNSSGTGNAAVRRAGKVAVINQTAVIDQMAVINQMVVVNKTAVINKTAAITQMRPRAASLPLPSCRAKAGRRATALNARRTRLVTEKEHNVPKEELLEFEGLVTEILPDARYRVQLDNGHLLIAYTAGRMKKNRIKTLAGDRVTVEVSPYDLEKGRLIFRHKSERAGASHPPPQRHQFRRR
jgi:translation initiation factor IF-1